MKKKTSLKSVLKKVAKKKKPQRKEPLWKGPEVDGITQSMISGFLECRERFRLKNIVGLQEVDTFNHRLEYGQMWHLCEESSAKAVPEKRLLTADEIPWRKELLDYCKNLCQKYVVAQEQISHWYQVCRAQFPIYVKYWEKHKDTKQRTPLLQEETFKVPYELPSGRVVLLRGKWDSVDLIGKDGIYLQENKTKGDIKEEQLKQQLGFDLQTMFYLIALLLWRQNTTHIGFPTAPISGVRYNVVRRPLSGGVGSIRQHKPTKKNPQGESAADFYVRLGVIISEDPSHFFMRWRVEVTPNDMERFRREFLDPILEQVCDWYEWIRTVEVTDPYRKSDDVNWYPAGGAIHWRTPYGCWNSLASGYTTELDEYLASGSTLGLRYADKLFTELE